MITKRDMLKPAEISTLALPRIGVEKHANDESARFLERDRPGRSWAFGDNPRP
jgi:hypothetical protein